MYDYDTWTPVATLEDLDIVLSRFEYLLRGIAVFRIECTEHGPNSREWFVKMRDPNVDMGYLGYVEAFEDRGRLIIRFFHPYRDTPLEDEPGSTWMQDYAQLLDYQYAGGQCRWLAEEVKSALQSHGILREDASDSDEPEPARADVGEGETSKKDEADVSTFDPTGGKYGTCRDLTIDDVRAIVAQCVAFQERGGKVPEFYRLQNILGGEARSYELETLRSWLRNPKLRPSE